MLIRQILSNGVAKVALWALLVASPLLAEAGRAADEPSYETDILPIFRAKCLRCHAGVEPKAKLNLSEPSALLTGGKSGAAIRIGAAEFSLLYEKVASDEMPAVGQKLTVAEKGLIRQWINAGAKGVGNATSIESSAESGGTQWWSFQPPVLPPVPTVADADSVRNPIDAFVLERLEAKQLTLAPEADRATLLRRASFDLLGLPPSPAEVEEFLADQRPDAFERLLERLLANPHYGERWGRHWLDLAGYADSAGILNEDRALPTMWRYRDYVIRAFNSDKPYDRFLLEQIAGDELTDYWTAYETRDRLPDEVVEAITATGFLRTAADASRPDFATIKNAAALYFYPTLFDSLQIVCSSTMGLTVQCARCHSHKFDPISQTDYYRMQAVFMTAYRPTAWIPQMERRLNVATKQQEEVAKSANAEVDANVQRLTKELETWKQQFAQRLFEERLAKLPADEQSVTRAAFDAAAATRTDEQKALVDKLTPQLRPAGAELEKALAETFADYQAHADELQSQLTAEQGRRIAFDEIRSLYDQPGAVTTPLLLRGDALTPGPPVEPGVISAVASPEPFRWQAPADAARTSGRRLAFARWLTQPHHPLTSRVIVNRIWQHHFGRGIVATPEDFGVSGSPPSHPELLDWLAMEFVRSGWSIKHMHRLILNSRTWRQQSRVEAAVRAAREEIDPDNRWLWRQRLQRLEAEPLRDAFQAAAGTLEETFYGPPLAVQRQPTGEVIVAAGPAQRRRSIYVQILRLNPETMLQLFDQPEIAVNCTERRISTVSTQALTVLNSDLMVRTAEAMAKRIEHEGAADLVGFAVLAAYGRRPAAEEHQLLSEFLANQTMLHLGDASAAESPEMLTAARRKALADLAHMLLSANEFAYVD